MNNETMMLLERHFDAAFAAPDGIKKLRELIVTLAMQGKLVPQDPNDEPASELLKAIEAEKKRLLKEGKIKQSKLLPKNNHRELPYQLPKSWRWVRLDELIVLISGQHLTPSEYNENGDGIPYYTGPSDFGLISPTSIRWTLLTKSIAIKGDILLTVKGAGVGKTNVLSDAQAAIGRQIMALRPIATHQEFVHLFLRSIFSELQKLSNGIAIPGISREDVLLQRFPLPPLAEQRRIVAEIDRLMARCDELEKLRADRSQKLLTVHTAALDNLLKAKESSDFSTAWHFITQNFSELYSVKENVAELRKAILQLAVMGKLVPQDPNDEPASELLKAIKLEKQQLLKEGKIQNMKSLPFVDPLDLPSKLPYSWQWSRIETICEVIVDCPHSTAKFIPNGIICIDTNSFKGGSINYHKLRYVSEETYLDRVCRLPPQSGDVIFAREGSVGESVIIPNGMKCCLGQRVMLFRPAKGVISRYLQLSISNSLFLTRLLSVHKGIGAKHVNVKDMRNALISIPPVAEQHRIVAEIDRLMALCDRLEESIEAAKGKQADLLNALMSQI